MQRRGHVVPNVLKILQYCISKKDIDTGRRVIDLLTKFGLDTDPFLGTHLIRLFAAGGLLGEALKVFHHLSQPSSFSWSAIISAHAKLGQDLEALRLYAQMITTNPHPDAHTFVAALTACSHRGTSQLGMLLHTHATEDCRTSSLYLGNCLINMYARRGSFDDACSVFETLPVRDAVSFSALISGYVLHGPGEESVRFFLVMQQEGMMPDKVIISSILNACARSKDLFTGKAIHSVVTHQDPFLESALVDMYACCSNVNRAQEVFDKICCPCLATWNAMISGYVQHGYGSEALMLFTKMKNKGVREDVISHLSLVKAGSCIGSLETAHIVHALILESSHEKTVTIDNSLIDMYAKCNCLEAVQKVFSLMKQRTVVTWNVLIGACAQLGSGQEALQYFQSMLHNGENPDSGTYISLLKASLILFSLIRGRVIHSNIMEDKLEEDLVVGNALVDMYVKCGQADDACRVFGKMPVKDVITWTSLIEGLAQCNRYDEVNQYFMDMRGQGVEPNSVTFLCLLSACNHMGLVHEGRSHFKMMKELYKIAPTLEHYSCMVDLLARGGLFDEAEEVICTMPFEFRCLAQKSLLNQCAMQHSVTTGTRCFELLVC